ncbi:hypothetical protein BWI17_00260 [Betaproteobacteria bacterium GR16-43]|nr:hypothetical protein BWI17_00260 [Betaproteobacteria bacterium GR16-43]
MAWLCVALAFLGFVPTYWIPMFRGTLDVRPLAHVHALIYYGWMLLFLRQTQLAAAGNFARHREWGVAGVALASAMVCTGIAMAIGSIKYFEALGHGPAARAFSVLPVTAMVLFGGLVAAALIHVRQPEWHKRFMLVATVSILQAAVARWFAVALAPPGPPQPPPIFVSIPPGIVVDLILVGAMLYDKKTRGSVHPAYWIGGGVVLFMQLIRIPLGPSSAWMSLTNWLVALSP